MAKNNTDNNKEKNKSIFKKILAAFVLVDIIVGIAFLVCYFKGCGPFNRSTSSISSTVDNTDYSALDNKFKQLVEKQIADDGFGDDHVNRVVAVSYGYRHDPEGFDLFISAISDSYLYNLKISGVQYKEGTDTLVSYLLCNNEIEGATSLYREQYTGVVRLVPTGFYVLSVPHTGTHEHKTGFELFNNEFHVLQLLDYRNDESGEQSLKQEIFITEDEPLYNYYRYLLQF